MNIVVCVKQVPYSLASLRISTPPTTIDDSELSYVVSPCDLLAVEEALRIKAHLDTGRTTVVTMGPERADRALRVCLAMGADEAVHICDESLEGSDAYATALVLHHVIAQEPFDLVLCGMQSADAGTAHVGVSLAELLGVPQATGVTKLELRTGSRTVVVQRRLERGDREVLELPLPAVCAVDTGINQPRYPTMRLRKKAAVAAVRRLDLASMALPGNFRAERSFVQITKLATPRPKPRKIFTPDSNLSAEERIRLLMSGGVVEKEGDFLEGSPDKVAEQVVAQLSAEHLLDLGK